MDITKLFITCAFAAAAVVALGAPARAQVGGGYYAAPAPWFGPQRYGIPSGPQCRSNTGIRRPGWCGGPRYDGSYGPQPADIPLPPPGGAYPPVSYPLPLPLPVPLPMAYGPPPGGAGAVVCTVDPLDRGGAPLLNVRASPAGMPIGVLPNGFPVVIIPELVGRWVHIIDPLNGWVFRPLLACEPPAEPPAAASAYAAEPPARPRAPTGPYERTPEDGSEPYSPEVR